MKMQSKIALYLGPFVLAVVTALFLLNYHVVGQLLTGNAQQELVQIEKSMHRAAQSLLSTAINNYLRGITEKNIDFIKARYTDYQQGRLTEDQAKEAVQAHFNTQTVGKSGYLVAVKQDHDHLFLDIHPYQRGQDCTETEGCRQWDKVRNGYTEYDWKNPFDNSYRKKAAYVIEFPPWNWIVGASSYRDEFIDLVKIEDLEQLIAPVRINRSGYFAVFNENGRLLIHPELKTTPAQDFPFEQVKEIFTRLRASTDGYLTYRWKNPSEQEARLKYAFIEKLEGFNWYLVATGYISEVHEPLLPLRHLTLLLVAVASVVLVPLIYHLSRQITEPLLTLERGVTSFDNQGTALRWQRRSIHEINVLGNAFARMTQQLSQTIADLQTKNEQLAISEQETRESRALLDSIINSMPSVIIGLDPHLRVTQWNSKAEHLTRLPAHAVHLRPLEEVFPRIGPHVDTIRHSIETNHVRVIPSHHEDAGGKRHHSEMTVYPLLSHGLRGAVLRIDDTTERVEMEQRLRQSQKMDAVGHLAGGMAHDFNNMLGGILGAADVLRLRVGADEVPLVQTISTAAERSSELIRKLLSFARKEHVALAPVDMHQVIADTAALLQRTLDKRITIEQQCAPQRALVMGDRGQLQSSLLNMGINAGQAMPAGGTLTFSTSLVTFDDQYCQRSSFPLRPGAYVRIEIRDTGTGISREHLKRIFEPFFTTKAQDKGTGLGLAAVYGSVQQHQGEILVDSEPGRGTVFTLHLPLTEAPQPEEPAHAEPVAGEGEILIIDDEPVIRIAVRFMLEGLGYTVHEAENGQAGVEFYRQHGHRIDLVLLDMLMPVMDGTECFRHLKALNPAVRVVIASGFTRDADLGGLLDEGLCGFIRKPYTLEQLSVTLHRILVPPPEEHPAGTSG
jgi:PAS domain S-box-containing protein